LPFGHASDKVFESVRCRAAPCSAPASIWSVVFNLFLVVVVVVVVVRENQQMERLGLKGVHTYD
jgi:hypothetical protein